MSIYVSYHCKRVSVEGVREEESVRTAGVDGTLGLIRRSWTRTLSRRTPSTSSSVL